MIRSAALISISLCVVCLFSTVEPASAQRPRRNMQSDEQSFGEKGERPFRERMESLRKVKLLEILELEGESVERFFARYTPLQRAVYDAKDALDVAVRSLKAADKSNADESTMTQRSSDIVRKQEELYRAMDRRMSELKPHLTARQYARYVAFEAGFLDDVIRLMMQRIRR